MKMPTAPASFRPRRNDLALRRRADLPAFTPAFQAIAPSEAAHDFLVPNARPDLTLDPTTLLMLEAR